MNYFVTRSGQQYGPYTLADLQRYVASGNILVTDMTRSEAMTEWVPVSQVIGNIPVPVVAAAAPSQPMLLRQGNRLVVVRGATLPPYCVKCGQPADAPPWDKNFSWANPLLGLLILLGIIGIIVYLIVYNTTRKQMRLTVPLCEAHRRARRNKMWIAVILLVTSPWLIVVGLAVNNDAAAGFGVLVLIIMLISGLVVLSLSSPLRPKKIDDAQALFAGAGEPFLQLIDSQRQQATGVGY